MKKISFSTILAVFVLLTLVTGALAEVSALPGSGWWSAEQIQNVNSCAGACDATVNVFAYDSENNANVYNSSKLIAKGASYTFMPADFPTMPSNFKGSVVVSSTGDVRAIGSLTNRSSGGLGDPLTPSAANGQYTAIVNSSITLLFPLVKNNHANKTTNFAIQNAGTGWRDHIHRHVQTPGQQRRRDWHLHLYLRDPSSQDACSC